MFMTAGLELILNNDSSMEYHDRFGFGNHSFFCFWDLKGSKLFVYSDKISNHSPIGELYQNAFLEYTHWKDETKIYDFQVYSENRQGLGSMILKYFEYKIQHIYSLEKDHKITGELVTSDLKYEGLSENEISNILKGFYLKNNYLITDSKQGWRFAYISKIIN